jgi:hypothetical protein
LPKHADNASSAAALGRRHFRLQVAQKRLVAWARHIARSLETVLAHRLLYVQVGPMTDGATFHRQVANVWRGRWRGDGMQGIKASALHLVPSFLVICLFSLGALCVAQEVETPDVPDAPDAGDGRGPVFAPSAWSVAIIPVHKRVDLKPYGFYVGELKAPVAQLDVPIRTTRFLTITPSYMYYRVPASGLNTLAKQPAGFTRSFDEHQFRIDGTVMFSVRKFEISTRSMYVRRFRPAPADDLSRYRHRIAVAHPFLVDDRIWKTFAAYEPYHEPGNGGWNRHRIWTGVTLPVQKHVSIQPSYMWETSQGARDVNYLLFGLIFTTR